MSEWEKQAHRDFMKMKKKIWIVDIRPWSRCSSTTRHSSRDHSYPEWTILCNFETSNELWHSRDLQKELEWRILKMEIGFDDGNIVALSAKSRDLDNNLFSISYFILLLLFHFSTSQLLRIAQLACSYKNWIRRRSDTETISLSCPLPHTER